MATFLTYAQKYAEDADTQRILDMDAENYECNMHRYPYFKIMTDEPLLNTMGEPAQCVVNGITSVVGPEFSQIDVDVPFVFIREPSQKELKRYGIDEEAEAVCEFSIRVCENLAFHPGEGDRFLQVNPMSGGVEQWEVIAPKLFDIHANTGVYLHIVSAAAKQREDLPDGTTAPIPDHEQYVKEVP